MYRVELYARVRRACRVEGNEQFREAFAEVFGLDRKTVRKMLSRFSVPPGYRRGKPPRAAEAGSAVTGISPNRDFVGRRSEALATTSNGTRSKRIFDRLRDEYGFTGGYTNREGLRS